MLLFFHQSANKVQGDEIIYRDVFDFFMLHFFFFFGQFFYKKKKNVQIMVNSMLDPQI